jgi:hypothetical protein
MSVTIKRFVYDLDRVCDDFTLGLDAGYIGKDGIIGQQQKGAEDTFSIGMPVYDKDNNEIGRLSIGLFKNLNYATRPDDGLDIPVEHWRVDGYTGEVQNIKTYWQVKADDPVNDLVVKSLADSTDVANPPKPAPLIMIKEKHD